VNGFHALLFTVVVSGTVAGLVWFAAQYFAVIPLIQKAETYEAAYRAAAHTHDEDEDGWKPENGWPRHSLTAVASVLTAIGFAAMLSGLIFLAQRPVNARSGALWGLACFTCFSLAPALGLPPQPPGTAVANLADRQVWWAATVLSTALGIYALAAPRLSKRLKAAGAICLALPHLIGAPHAQGETLVPPALVRQFAIASISTSLLFWLTLGILSGAALSLQRASARLSSVLSSAREVK
jgi:cobalt transporter subunit CbtA